MATYVLVHGAGHGGWCYQPVARLLRAQGHEVYTPTLTGVGERSHLLAPSVGLDTHITDIVQLIAYEDLHDVILAGHSYGGAVITGVADRIASHLRQLVFLDAAMPAAGDSLISLEPALAALAAENRTVNGVELGLWPDSAIAQMIYGLGDCTLAEWARARHTPHPWRSFTDPLVLSDPERVARIPRTIINCRSTLEKRAGKDLSRYYAAERVWEIDTGHDLMLSAPEATAEMLLRLA